MRRRFQMFPVPQQGFALIVTLTLMALIASLTLALVTLSRNKVSAASVMSPQAEARANARMALGIAIGELQRYAGSDLVVTAPASVLSQQGFAGISADPSKQNLVMVMSTEEMMGDPAASPWAEGRRQAFRRYLVSGNQEQVAQLEFANQPMATDATSVRMTSLGAPPEHQVLAPLVPVNEALGRDQGAYAWWISGLGAKASAVLTRPADDAVAHKMPDRFAIRAAAQGAMDWLPESTQPEALAKIITTKSFEHFAPQGQGVNDQLHWIGSNNRALLVNPLTGNLKVDLTVALTQDVSSGEITNLIGTRMFQPAGGGAEGQAEDPGGPTWQQAKSYFDLTGSSALDVRPQTETQMGIYPVIAGFTEFYGASNTNGYSPEARSPYFPASWFNTQNGRTPSWVMTMHMSPVVKLWNPYNRPLNTSSYTIAVKNSDLQYRGGKNRDESSLTWSGQRPSFLPLGMRFEHRYLIPSCSFEPGEVKIFSLARNTFLDSYMGGNYRPGPGGSRRGVGNQVDVIGDGYILAELSEQPFRGYTLWDMHCTAYDVEEYDAENDPQNYYITGRATGGWTLRGTIASDGSKTVINDTRLTQKLFEMDPGDLVTWSLELYQGRVPKTSSAGGPRPLVTIKNINTAANRIKKRDPDINEVDRLDRNFPFFRDQNLDGIWARTLSLRQATNLLDGDRTALNAARHGTKDVKWLADFNPRSPTIGCWPEEFSKQRDRNGFYAGDRLRVDGQRVGGDGYGLGTPGNYLSGILLNMGSIDDALPQPFIGFSDSGATDRCVLFEVPEGTLPEAHFISIGQLRHANLSIENGNLDAQRSTGYGPEDFFSDNTRPAYGIGESLPDIRLDPTENQGTFRTLSVQDGSANYSSTHYDFSWHMNQLWDSTFFSARNGNDDGKSSFNPRISVIDPQTQRLEGGVEGAIQNAARLFLEGGFNVNNTNPQAWMAFLGATLGTGVSGQGAEGEAPFSRFSQPIGSRVSSGEQESSQGNYDGYRVLNESEIRALAEAIAEQVRLRGPFISLSEFVNRAAQTGAPSSLTRMGALQAAIDQAGLNQHMGSAGTRINEGDVGQIYNQEAYAGDIAHSVPGYLTQGDLLARMGHLLTTRSDTFVVRAYGEARDANGEVTAKAWCEAEVQRFPDFVDPADSVETPFAQLSSGANRQLGRRFRVTSFRWIPEDEIQ